VPSSVHPSYTTNAFHGSASFDLKKVYRYTLVREYPGFKRCYSRRCVFVMLNPSTADERVTDPTVARCLRYAKDWGFDNLTVLNIFALRATDPRELYSHPNPMGETSDENDNYIRFTLRRQWEEGWKSKRIVEPAPLVICAWGNHGTLHGRGSQVRQMLLDMHVTPHYLRLNKSGEPQHPLYLRADLKPIPWV